jgi:hypothetical protein
MSSQSQQLFSKTWNAGSDARKAERQEYKNKQAATRRRLAAQERTDAARRDALLPQIEQEVMRVIQQMDTREWRGAEQLTILRNAFGWFGKKLGAIRLRGEGFEHILMPRFLATDGNIYMYMRSDLAEGYGKLNLRRESTYELEDILKLLKAST